MYKLMIVEDDANLSATMKRYIEKYGYEVCETQNFNNIEEEFEKEKPHLLLLDINLPYYDGFYLCRAIRTRSNIPIIIVSSRDGEMDQVMAIELGADDYITKPLKLEVLMAKIKAAVRRVYGKYSKEEDRRLKIGGLILQDDTFSIKYSGRAVELSKNEYKLIKKFMERAGEIITKETLFEELWDDSNFVDENTLSVNITRIKNRFKELGITEIIKNKRGLGYIFDGSVLEDRKNEKKNYN